VKDLEEGLMRETGAGKIIILRSCSNVSKYDCLVYIRDLQTVLQKRGKKTRPSHLSHIFMLF
jgi:hypothetical protein